MQRFDPSKVINVELIKAEIEQLVSQKLEELTPSMIKHLLEGVMADHLGWLIIWGNIFGNVNDHISFVLCSSLTFHIILGGAIGLATKAINIELQVFDISEFRF
jgi:hypothetical protein